MSKPEWMTDYHWAQIGGYGFGLVEKPAPEPSEACKAQEWNRDGRGWWAMRECRLPAKHCKNHEYSAWSYHALPAGTDISAADAQTIATLRAERDAFRDEANAIRRNYLAEAKDLAQRADAAEAEVARLSALVEKG